MKKEFDDKAATWDDDPIRVARAETIAKSIANRIELATIGTALEYGSGTGLLSFALKDRLSNITMMDESLNMIEVAKQKCSDRKVSHIKPLQYDLMTEPLPENKFDLIYMLLTLHHVLDYQELLATFYEILNKNGFLAIIDLVTEDGSFHEGEFHGHNGFDKLELESILKSIGFSISSYEICYELERETENGKRKYPLFLSVVQKR